MSQDVNDSNFVFFQNLEYRDTENGSFNHWWPVLNPLRRAGLLNEPCHSLGQEQHGSGYDWGGKVVTSGAPQASTPGRNPAVHPS